MTLEIKLTPERLARLKAAAEARGIEPETYVEDMLDSLPPVQEETTPGEDRTLELFAHWEKEDATDDPEEQARRESEWQELKANLNANRAAADEKPLFP